MKKRTLQELTIMDNFMFGAVMLDAENCRMLLERILEFPIEHVSVSTEKSIVYHPEFHGVRLDVYAKDENNTRYNVEMQVSEQPILRRSRYYHAQIDMDLLRTGLDYELLPDTYVIFICNYDPFNLGKYRYTINKAIMEDRDYEIEDGVHTIILSNRGTNADEVSAELVSFLEYTKDNISKQSTDELVKQLEESIRKIKADRDMEARFMSLELYIHDQRKEARAEGRAEGKAEGKAEGRTEGKQELIESFLNNKGFMSAVVEKSLPHILERESPEQLLIKIVEIQTLEEFEEYLAEKISD